jgi:type III pantothenate kinase
MRYYLDCGNTHIKLATWFRSETGVIEWQILGRFKDAETCIAFLKTQKKYSSLVGVSVTRQHESIVAYLQSAQVKVTIYSAQTPLPFTLKYDHLAFGHDRILALAGAQFLYNNTSTLVIDAGTCIKYQILTQDGIAYGGAISPGIEMRLKAMATYTHALPEVQFNATFFNETALTTAEALWAGSQTAVLKEIEGFVQYYNSFWPNLNVVITGGYASYLSKGFKNRYFEVPDLLFFGLYALFDHPN